MANKRERAIIRDRMNELMKMAFIDEKNKYFEYSRRKIELIFLYSQKYKVRIPEGMRTLVCRKCKQGIYSTGGHIRIKNSRINVHCGNCGYTRRFRIIRQ